MKKLSISLFSALLLAMTLSVSIVPQTFADDTVSAPQVVAPAQPVTAQAATTTTAITTTTAAAPATAPSLMGMAMPFVIMLGIMYFLMIRPQQKRMKDHQSLITALKAGDEVITNSGIIGTIAGMSEKVVTLEVSKNVQMKILKSQVNQVVKGPIQDIQPTA